MNPVRSRDRLWQDSTITMSRSKLLNKKANRTIWRSRSASNGMKTIKKIFASSSEVDEAVVPSAPKVNTTGFLGWKEKMKGLAGNFRQKAEQAGVPPERVKDFKYWLRENNEQIKRPN